MFVPFKAHDRIVSYLYYCCSYVYSMPLYIHTYIVQDCMFTQLNSALILNFVIGHFQSKPNAWFSPLQKVILHAYMYIHTLAWLLRITSMLRRCLYHFLHSSSDCSVYV